MQMKMQVNFLIKTVTLAFLFSGVVVFFLLANGSVTNQMIPLDVRLDVKNRICAVNHVDTRNTMVDKNNLSMIYFVTPTYPRPSQIPELVRLSHTLMHVPRIHWIVADDQPRCSVKVTDVLSRTGLPYTHISSPKPFVFKGLFPRGVANRRAALAWIRENANEGILYFGDDDNTFDLQLFPEIRRTKQVSMLPVGLIGEYGVSSPVVRNGKVVAFYDSWPAGRTYPVDMAGFAVNIQFLKPKASMPYIAGQEENRFLLSLDLKIEDIEPLADNCSKVYVWHTKTEKFVKSNVKLDISKFDNPKYAPFAKLLRETVNQGIANIFPNNGTEVHLVSNKKKLDIERVLF